MLRRSDLRNFDEAWEEAHKFATELARLENAEPGFAVRFSPEAKAEAVTQITQKLEKSGYALHHTNGEEQVWLKAPRTRKPRVRENA